MSQTVEILGQQHQEVLAQLSELEAVLGSPAAPSRLAAFHAYLEGDVLSHFALEEEALFPVIERYLGSGQGPLAVMSSEHEAFRKSLRNLGTALRGGALDQQHLWARDIIGLLRSHIAKEDGVLFPMATRILSPEDQLEVDRLAATLEEHRERA